MSVVFEIPSVLLRFSDGQTSINVDGADVEAVLDSVWKRFPDLRQRVLTPDGELYPYLLLFHNGDKLPRTDLATIPLDDGDRLELVGLAEGG